MVCHKMRKYFAQMCQQVKQPAAPCKQPRFILVQQTSPSLKKPAEKDDLGKNKIRAWPRSYTATLMRVEGLRRPF